MERELPPEATGFMPRRVKLSNIPSSYGFRALKKATDNKAPEKLALEEIWAEADRKAKTELIRSIVRGADWERR